MFLYIPVNKHLLTCRILLHSISVAVWSPPKISVAFSCFLKQCVFLLHYEPGLFTIIQFAVVLSDKYTVQLLGKI